MNKLKQTAAFLLAAFLALFSLVGCKEKKPDNSLMPDSTETLASAAADETAEPTQEPAATSAPEQYSDDAAWFCPAQVMPSFDSPAVAINIATGDVLVACPDPLCTHSEGSETCFFNQYHDDTCVYAVEYLLGHIYFVADKQTDDGRVMKLYDYDIGGNRIDGIFTYPFAQSMASLFKNSDTLFFSAITEGGEKDSENWIIGLYSYDPVTGTVALIDGNARYALGSGGAVFFDDSYIHDAGSSLDEDGEHYWYCRCSYDSGIIERFDSLPDGTPFSPMGWSLKPSGVFANTWGEGGMYLIEDGIKLAFPTDSATTVPVRFKDDYYFQTRGSEFVRIGKDPYTGEIHKNYPYDNELYVMNKDGSYKHYTIDCEYHFITAAVYENVIIGLIEYRIPAPGQCMMGGDSDTYILPDFIRIDLGTGETTVYDTTMRNGFIKETFVCTVTLNEN